MKPLAAVVVKVVLCMGAKRPHKNLARVIEAVAEMPVDERPVLVIQQRELIRRTVWAYLLVWIAAYICFIIYPTIAPRPELVAGDGFTVRSLRFL